MTQLTSIHQIHLLYKTNNKMNTLKLLFEILLFSTIGNRDYPVNEKATLPQKQTYYHSIKSEDDAGRGKFY